MPVEKCVVGSSPLSITLGVLGVKNHYRHFVRVFLLRVGVDAFQNELVLWLQTSWSLGRSKVRPVHDDGENANPIGVLDQGKHLFQELALVWASIENVPGEEVPSLQFNVWRLKEVPFQPVNLPAQMAAGFLREANSRQAGLGAGISRDWVSTLVNEG